jgi:hypothetical protein
MRHHHHLLRGSHRHPRQLFETLYTLRSRAIKMAVCSNKRKNLLTDDDISKVLDIVNESDIFSEESDDFWFDTSEEDSDGDSDTSSVLNESVSYEEVQIFRNLLYLTAWCVQDLHFSV